jgi:hypothetical protein
VGGGAIQRSCCALGNGSGRSMSVLTTLKTAMLAPMANARMSTATVVNPGSRPSVRRVYFRSCRRMSRLIRLRASRCCSLACCMPPNSKHCLALSLVWSHAARDVLVDCEVDVSGQLGFEFSVESAPREKSAEATGESAEAAHAGFSLSPRASSASLPLPKTRSMTPVRRSQWRASAASWRRPALVME